MGRANNIVAFVFLTWQPRESSQKTCLIYSVTYIIELVLIKKKKKKDRVGYKYDLAILQESYNSFSLLYKSSLQQLFSSLEKKNLIEFCGSLSL